MRKNFEERTKNYHEREGDAPRILKVSSYAMVTKLQGFHFVVVNDVQEHKYSFVFFKTYSGNILPNYGFPLSLFVRNSHSDDFLLTDRDEPDDEL